MSNYDDDQSEDGELARSPVHQDEIDFSLSDDDMDTADSLDIRPPQAKLMGQPSKDRGSRHGKSRHKDHSRRDKKHSYRERDKLEVRGKKESDPPRISERDTFHSKEHYRDRDREREYVREHYREKEVAYREKEGYREKQVDVYREKETYRYKEPYREKEAYRERDRRPDKEPSHRDAKDTSGGTGRDRDTGGGPGRDRDNSGGPGRDRDTSGGPGRDRDGRNSSSSGSGGVGRKDRDRDRDRASGGVSTQGDKELEDLRSRLLSKRREQQQEKREENTEARKAHLERMNKILLADRETSRRKEEGRAALEERRNRRTKRSPSPSNPNTSHLPGKKPRGSLSPQQQHNIASSEVVTLSDASDHDNHDDEEAHSGESSGTSSTESDADDTEGSDAGGSEDISEEDDEEEQDNASKTSRGGDNGRAREGEGAGSGGSRDRTRSGSPASDRSDGMDASPRNRRRRSRTRSRSRSRSHSFSPPKDANGEEIHHMEGGEDGGSKKKMEGGGGGEGEEGEGKTPPHAVDPLLPPYYPAIQGCRSVEEFQCLNRIEEGTYGVVYRAKDKTTEEIVALKRLKMEKEKEGFPITSLREINTLLKGQHPNIVTVREIVVGSNMDKIFIVMDYVEHDLKGLMETMRAKKQVFLPGEVKCLMQQLLKAVDHLHDNWILHRDLKTSNLLLSHKGILKVGDFGLAREYGSPLKNYTPVVVTLWYRAPELLLGARTYSTPIDMWSVGCIYAEFLTMQALFPGKSEVDQLNRIFKDLGTPNETVWPGWSQLSGSKAQWADQPGLGLRNRVGPSLSDSGLHLLQGLLTYDPTRRLQASTALAHNYFKELPQAIDPAMFPTWPAKSEGAKRQHSPKPPPGGDLYKQLMGDDVAAAGFHMGSTAPAPYLPPPTSFSLKF